MFQTWTLEEHLDTEDQILTLPVHFCILYLQINTWTFLADSDCTTTLPLAYTVNI